MSVNKNALSSLDAVARSLAFYLKAAWSVAPKVMPLAQPVDDGELMANRPSLTGDVLFIPDARIASDEADDQARFYIASVAHVAAHLTWSSARYERGKLRPLQIALVGTIEDARVERLALQRYPGLRHWWLPFHRTGTQSAKTAAALIARLSRALLDPDYLDDDGWVKKGRALFDAAFDATSGNDPAISRELGNLLGNDLGQMRMQFNAKTYTQDAAYRDDNSFVWNAEPTPVRPSSDDAPAERNATLQSAPTPRDAPPDDDRPPRTRAESDGDAQTTAASPEPVDDDDSSASVVSVAHYREWDYMIRRYRNEWCRVESIRAEPGNRRALLPSDESAERRIRVALRMTRQRVPFAKGRSCEGDMLDLDACIAGRIDARRGVPDHAKGFVVPRMRPQGGPLVVLLDVSTSAVLGDRLEAAMVFSCRLGRALAANGRPFAMYGFHSDGRQRVRFHIFKEFANAWSGAAEAALMSVRPGLSTRFGAALRHVGTKLSPEMNGGAAVAASVLVVSDGVPFDIDSFDPRYLRDDMRRAIRELAACGIQCGCVSFDARSLDVARAAFGRDRVVLVSDEAGLSRVLRRVAALTS